jgi:hypothetical protein
MAAMRMAVSNVRFIFILLALAEGKHGRETATSSSLEVKR